MTDSNDIRSDDADSGRTVDEKLNAEVIATSGPDDDPDVYLVQYGDGSQVYEPATVVNKALFEDGLYEQIQGRHEYYTDAPGRFSTVALDADVQSQHFVIESELDQTVIPNDQIEDVIDAVRGTTTGTDLFEIQSEILEGQVRQYVVSSFEDRFPEDRVETKANGWVVDDTFLVDYEGNNYLKNADTTYKVRGGEVVEANEDKQAVELGFSVDSQRDMTDPNGDEHTLTSTEQEFLATVECLLFPEEYLDAELVDDIQQAKAHEFASDDIESIAETANVSAFTDTKTQIHHNHGFDKHRAISEAAVGDLDSTLGMTEEAVDMLYFNDYDHAACHELVARRTEFENAPFDIFEDAPNDDQTRWAAIRRAKGSAPIEQEHKNKIQSMFGN